MTADRAFEFIETIAHDTDPASISGRLFDEAAALGFTGMAMGWLPEAGTNDPAQFQVAALPEEYFRRYAELRYDRHSAVVRHMSKTNLPFRWDEIQVDRKVDPLAHQILAEARDFGIKSGWSVPVYRRGGLRGFATLTSSVAVGRSPDLFQFHLMTLCAHARVQDLRGVLEVVELGVRERDILSWMAAGKDVEEISSVLGISSRGVIGEVVGAGAKLGTSSPIQTVIEAVRLGLIG